MYYDNHDYLSAVTEERLASIVCEGVKDYLSEANEYVRRCQATIARQRETIDALLQQVADLKECIKACKGAQTKHIYNRCEVTQNYQSEQTLIVNPTFGAMYDIHGNGKVKLN